MAAQLDPQIYLDASYIAYESDPVPDLARFLPQYKLVKRAILKDGLQAHILQSHGADAHYLIAFRGTDPAFGVIIDEAKAVAADEAITVGSPVSGLLRARRYERDLNNLFYNPSVQDLLTDLQIFEDKSVNQYNDALAIVRNYALSGGPPIYVTGHSLGGGIADFVAGALSNITGMTFAAPGYKKYGNASAASMINYYNVNDTIPTVNLQYHCGAIKSLDYLYSSFAVEHELGFRSSIVYGFNETPNITTAITAHNNRLKSLVIGSLGFLVARLIFHDLGNYALLLKRIARNGKTHVNTIKDFAQAAHDIMIKAMWIQRERQSPLHGLNSFFWRLTMDANQIESDNINIGWFMMPD
ncbi:MAG TPA: hypothetical protein PK677_00240 [Acidiphilium sp.]|nr:MAG: hypothetical protein B7Z67_03180 [Acidiphilium sp. 21-60-14]OYV91099.1 MAG: hypothetical protein B7Z57_05475 [Acidiphilium sp. 37-60-79]OZB39993.1 MAG: hypothetical protein B7X48_07080 [Acidiphilium sp. 34-60-192]HQT86961.1 hypothetical protein [Acidiphilium sp.]HQU22992.1 hypothetical protein [Acidiphilium sp.]